MRNDKILAYKMRMRGQSYAEISKGLGMSKSTLSTWFRHLTIPKEAQEKINNRSRAASINALLKINKLQTHRAEERVRISRTEHRKAIGTLSKRELLLLGSGLYWAEGYRRPIVRDGKARTHHPVSFTNSDPGMVKLFLRFLREICEVPEEKISADLRIYEHQNEAHLLDFWSKTTDISYSRLKKFYYKKSYDTLPYGTIQIRVNSTPLFHKIMGWIEGLQNS